MALLRFVTLFSKDVHVAVNFYRGLGLEFVQEKHGDGPLHYSHAGSSVTIEIYPLGDASADTERCASDVMLGLEVGSLDRIVAAVTSNGGAVLKDIAGVDLGRRIVVQDPEGRKIYVYSRC